MNDTPRIYVACLATYNNGHLHGAWIDCDQEAEEIEAEISEMLKNSPQPGAEEWAIHDYENWHGIEIDEYENIEKLAELAQALAEHGKPLAVYYQHFGEIEGFEDRYLGVYESEEDFAYETLEQQGLTQKIEELGLMISYIDWAAIARDWFICDYLSAETAYQEVHVFNLH